MFEVTDLDATAALEAVVERRRSADAAEAEILVLAAHWADLHAALPGEEGARLPVPGMQEMQRLAGEGTPEVAEFAPAELAAALRITTYAGGCLVGEALELRHRLPRVWARVMDGSLQAWRARRIAQHTMCLPREGAAWVDGKVATVAHRVGIKRLLDLIAAALWTFDPEQARRRFEESREQRGVWAGDEIVDGSRSVYVKADARDVAAFDAAISAVADALGEQGNEDRLDVRRAKAVGVLADPEAVLALLTNAAPGEGSTTAPAGSEDTAAKRPRARRGARSRARGRLGGRPVIYVHLHADALAQHGDAALGRVEGGGQVAAQQVREWLGDEDITVQPVIDLAGTRSVDAYEAPDDVVETVILRNPCCPFPWCNNLGRCKDMDHVEEYQPPEEGGPPGQTGPDTLSPVCRRHHRLKTHGGWTCTMPEPGIYLWRSPLGRRYLVDHTGTTSLDDAFERALAESA